MNEVSSQIAPYAVGVVLYRNAPLLERLRASLEALTPRPARILLWDNGSADGSREWIASNWPGAVYEESRENLGFAEAHNRLLARALSEPETEGYLCLNSDALLEPDFFAKAPAALDLSQNVGAVQPLVGRLDERMQRTGVLDTTGICFDAREGLFFDRHAGLPLERAPRGRGEVFGCSGAVALYHRAYLDAVCEKTGWFDRRFFAYYEDVDLAWRARRFGWKAVFAPEARAWHRRYGSMRAGETQEALLYRNRLWLHAKNEAGWALTSPKQAARELLNLARALTTRPHLRRVLKERYGEARLMRRAFDPELQRVDPRAFGC